MVSVVGVCVEGVVVVSVLGLVEGVVDVVVDDLSSATVPPFLMHAFLLLTIITPSLALALLTPMHLTSAFPCPANAETGAAKNANAAAVTKPKETSFLFIRKTP